MIPNSTANSKTTVYDDDSFELLFKTHFKALHAYGMSILRDEQEAEEIVQQVFLKFWEKRNTLTIETSVKAYLYKSVYNDCLNHLRNFKTRLKYQGEAHRMTDLYERPASARVEMNEFQSILNEAINELPEKCRTIFQMSRFEELKYREIAEKLGLSVKTVENQMSKALKILRLELSGFLVLFIAALLYFKDLWNI